MIYTTTEFLFLRESPRNASTLLSLRKFLFEVMKYSTIDVVMIAKFCKYIAAAAAAAKSLQSCPTLCDPRDGSPPGSPIPGILQARTLEWVAISFSNA